MFYRPHFCCHCGEKIIRAKWTPLTSRRFCDFCAIEQKQHDLIPRAAAIAVILFGAAGMTAYLGSGRSARAPESATTSAAKFRDSRTGPTPTANEMRAANLSRANLSAPAETNSESASIGAAPSNIKQRSTERNSSTEAVYYCGAITKKGTACTRRVKSPGRCWQHSGQPPMSSLQN